MQVTGQPKARYIGCSMYVCGSHGRTACRVQFHHRIDYGPHFCFGDLVDLCRSTHDASAQGLGEIQYVTRACAFIAHNSIGGNRSEHREAILWFRVVDGVTAGNEGSRFSYSVCSALEDSRCDIGSE